MIQPTEQSLKEVQQIKSEIEKHKGESFPIYTYAKDELKWSPTDVKSLLRAGLITKEPFEGSKIKNIYTWKAGEPDFDMLKRIVYNRKKMQNEKNKELRERKKRKDQEKEMQAAKESKQPETEQVNQIPVQAEEVVPAPQKKEPATVLEENANEEKLPISVEVVSEGGKKTVTIKIQV